MVRTLRNLLAAACLPLALGGCLAAAAVEVVAETVEAGVEITGAVVGTTVDVITPDGDDDDKKEKKKKKDKDKD